MLISLVLVLSLCGHIDSQSYSEMNQLLDNLLNSTQYNKQLRPLWNQHDIIQVNFTQSLFSIESFDIQAADITTQSIFFISWYDELLTWTPSNYGNTTTLALPRNYVWTPQIAIAQRNDEDIFVDSSEFSPTWVTYTGLVTMLPAGNYKTKCKIDTTFYPFDEHECDFSYILANQLPTELTFNIPTGDIDTSDFVENGEWTIESRGCKTTLTTVSGASLPAMKCTLTVYRRPLYETLTFYSPLIFLGVLNLASSCIPPTSGERLSYVVTIYLAFVFMMLALVERIPRNSLKMPMLSWYTMVINFVNTLVIVYNIYILYLTHTPPDRIWTLTILKKLALKQKIAGYAHSIKATNKKNKVEALNDKSDSKNDDINMEDNVKPESDEMATLSGLEIARTCDRLWFRAFMVFFVLTFMIIYGILILQYVL